MERTHQGSPLCTNEENLERSLEILANLALSREVDQMYSCTASQHLCQTGHRLAAGCCRNHAVHTVKEGA